MQRFTSTLLLSAAIAVGAPSIADGQTPTGFGQVVHRSGAVYHVEVCPGPASSGTARCHAHVVTDSQGRPVARSATTNVTPSGYGPASLRTAYGVTGVGWTSPPTIAIVDAYGYTNAERDLNVYRSQFNLGACTTANGCFRKYNQKGVQGSYPRQNNGWALETALDLQMASAMCPLCKIILVEANSNKYSDLAAAENMAASLGAHAISNSYGGGEIGSSVYSDAYWHPGIAITVSSGDSGYGVSFPASAPFVTAVGGTTLKLNSGAWSESAWSGAGSGCSSVYSKQYWQADQGCPNRTVADVSAIADPNTGVAVYGPVLGSISAWAVLGGTSVAAPLIAGIYGANGGTVAYGSDPYTHTLNLNDVISGSNGGCGSYLCNAGQGYDGPTGLGTPKGFTAF